MMNKKYLLVFIFSLALISCTEEVIFDFKENLERELEEIDDFLALHNISTDIHESETRISVLRQGIGDAFERRDTVFYNFQIYRLDSLLVETNLNEVRLANGLLPAGGRPARKIFYGIGDFSHVGFLNIAFELGRDQSKFHMFVPSHMAYGMAGRLFNENRHVPPNTPLLVEIEIIEVRYGD